MKRQWLVRTQRRLIQLSDVKQPALRHDFRKYHRDGLQGLDFLFVVLARSLVLHGQHTKHLPAAEDRHAEEGMEWIFPCLRPIGEPRMMTRVAKVQRFG